MRLTTYYVGPPKVFNLPDELWPCGDIEAQARVAIGLWVGNPPEVRWTGSMRGVERVGNRFRVALGLASYFDFTAEDVGGPW